MMQQHLTELCKDPFKRRTAFQDYLEAMQSPITNLARVLNQIAEKGGAADDWLQKKLQRQQQRLR